MFTHFQWLSDLLQELTMTCQQDHLLGFSYPELERNGQARRRRRSG